MIGDILETAMRRILRHLGVAAPGLLALAAFGCKGKEEPTYGDAMVRGLREAKASQARGDLQTISIAITQYVSNDGNLADVRDMDALVAALQPTWLRVVPRMDPWDRSYIFQADGDSWTLLTSGVDGTPGNADDMVMRDGQLTQMPRAFTPMGRP